MIRGAFPKVLGSPEAADNCHPGVGPSRRCDQRVQVELGCVWSQDKERILPSSGFQAHQVGGWGGGGREDQPEGSLLERVLLMPGQICQLAVAPSLEQL